MESNSDIAADVDIVCMRGDTFARTLKFWQDEAKTIIGEGLSITPPNVLELGKDAKEMAGLPRFNS